MNATSPISQAPRSPDPIQAAAPTAADQAARGNSQDFAGALSDAGGRTARKQPAAKQHSAAKQHDSAPSGSALPASGNQQPLSLPPPAIANASTIQAGSSAGAKASQAAAVAPKTAPTPAPAASAAAVGDPSSGAQPANGTPQPGAQTSSAPVAGAVAGSAAAAAASVDAAAQGTTPAAGTVFGAGPTMPHAPSARSLAAPAPSDGAAPDPTVGTAAAKTAAPPPPAAVNNTDAKPNDGPASKADIAAATSAPTSPDVNAQNAPTAANAPGAADTDAASQAVMAAAIAQGTSAPSPDSSAASDDLATPDTGVTLPGVAAANDSPALPSGAPAVHAAAPTSASVTAASAASIVQAATASADSGATDKHSHSSSSDGTIGATQLLTSNAPSDTSPGPAPTFKVGAGVETAEFGQGVADRVSLMMDGNLTSAKLQVNPPALGPIEVRIALQGGHAQISLSSHSAVTRDALEATSPKLREMLGSQGFSQVSVDISHRSFQDSSRQAQPYERLSAVGADSPAVAQSAAATARSASGLLDAYA